MGAKSLNAGCECAVAIAFETLEPSVTENGLLLGVKLACSLILLFGSCLLPAGPLA